MFEQDRVLVRLQQYVLRERDILVCFLSGSYGRGQADGYSDLDVAFVFADDFSRTAAYNRRREIVQAVMPYVPAKSFDAEHIRPFFHIALYGNGTKADFRFETKAELQPNPWDRDIRILKDSDGWGEQFQTAAAQLPPTLPRPTITANALIKLDERFWIMFWDVYRLVLRGDHEKPFPIYLELLFFTLPELIRLVPPEDLAHQALIELSFSKDTQATANHLRRLFKAYLAARSAVVRRHNLVFTANSGFETAVQKLIARHGS